VNEHFRDLKIEMLPVDSLRPYRRNPRTHSHRQIQQIAASIQKFGFTNPVLIDEERRVIAGHGRIEAAKLLGISDTPTIRLEEMTEAQKRAYLLADNKLAENAGWDQELLALELADIAEIDNDFDLTLIGFETAEIDILLDSAKAHGPNERSRQRPRNR
jgi:ParB-like chromosome segregation protein Spo0J